MPDSSCFKLKLWWIGTGKWGGGQLDRRRIGSVANWSLFCYAAIWGKIFGAQPPCVDEDEEQRWKKVLMIFPLCNLLTQNISKSNWQKTYIYLLSQRATQHHHYVYTQRHQQRKNKHCKRENEKCLCFISVFLALPLVTFLPCEWVCWATSPFFFSFVPSSFTILQTLLWAEIKWTKKKSDG